MEQTGLMASGDQLLHLPEEDLLTEQTESLACRTLASFRTFPMLGAIWFVKFLPQGGGLHSEKEAESTNAPGERREAAHQLFWGARAGRSLSLE